MPIRAARAEDIPRVVELSRQFHAESSYRKFAFDAEWLSGMFGRCAVGLPHEVLFLVAHRADDVYGYLLAHMSNAIMSRRKAATLDLIYVRADRRGSITGPAMLRRYMQWAASLSSLFIDFAITTGIAEESTRRLAKRFGFDEAGMVFRWHAERARGE